MRRTRGSIIDVVSLDDLDRRLAQGARSLSGWRLHSLDLTARHVSLGTVDVAGALFLGCDLLPEDDASVRARGAVVFPNIPSAPVDSYRTSLYAPAELFGENGYRQSLDARLYAWSQCDHSRSAALARALHDHNIGEALSTWTQGRHIVGVMGGHSAQRGGETYADGATIGHLLGQSCTVATGGGPGAMEAVNLGAYLSTYDESVLAEALVKLAEVPSFMPNIALWAQAAFDVKQRFSNGADSLGIPTWHYGHEPPNPFASAIAKFFQNAQREALLLEICDAGIVFLPGAGGTIQEIFQDACENYYADESSIAPMILVGREYWTEQFPAWQLLKALAHGRPMQDHVHLVDSVQDAAALVSSSA